jgi:uncharacterized protein (TIRG00374 family)
MVKNRLNLIIRVGVSCLFGGYLAFKVDWTLLGTAFKKIDLSLYAASTLLTLASTVAVACKYHLLIKGTSIARPILYLTKVNLISRFYALFLPSALGPEAVRWYKVTRNQEGRALFSAATVFERLTFLLVLLLFGSIPLFFYASHSEIISLRIRVFPVVTVSLSLICICLSYFIFPVVRSFFTSIIERTIPSRWNSEKITSFLQQFSLHKPGLSLFTYIFAINLVWQMLFLSRLFVLFKAASLPLGFIDVAWMGSLVLLLQLLPISFAGIGVREAGYAYFFTLYSLHPDKGVFIGILFFSQMLILASIGGLLEATEH